MAARTFALVRAGSRETLESMTARATFNGPNVNIETVDVRLIAGHIIAKGNLNTNPGFRLSG